MNAQVFQGRLFPGTVAVAAAAVFLTLLVSFLAAAPVAAQGPSGCFEQLDSGAQPQAITFASATYTLTIPTGTDVCIETRSDLLLGFLSTNPFAVDGNGASTVGTDFLYPMGPVAGTLVFDVTAVTPVKLALTDVNGSGNTILVWLGNLKAPNAASATPAPVASATSMVIMKAGDTVTKRWVNGNKPFWGPFTQVMGSLNLEVTASVAFTMTSDVGYSDLPAAICGSNCWKVSVPAHGSWKASELKGLYWTDLFVGEADARVLMPAPVQPASPASGAAESDNQKTGGGAADGEAPSVWASSPAPASRPIWLPLLIRPSR